MAEFQGTGSRSNLICAPERPSDLADAVLSTFTGIHGRCFPKCRMGFPHPGYNAAMIGGARQAWELPSEKPMTGLANLFCARVGHLLIPALGAMVSTVSCGGTSGHEDLPSQSQMGDATGEASDEEGGDGGDATLSDDSGLDDADLGSFDVTIYYADRMIPDVVAAAAMDGGGTMDAADAHGSGLTACTTAGQTECVACPNEPNGVCTQTEAMFVQLDIKANLVGATTLDAGGLSADAAAAAANTDGGLSDYSTKLPSKSGNCLSCLVAATCIDNPSRDVKNRECDDFTSDFTAGNGAKGTQASACLAVLGCMLAPAGQGCAANPQGDSFCYCGPAGFAGVGPAACVANGAIANGPCFTQEVNGFAYPEVDSLDILNAYTDQSGSNPAGIVNQIMVCAQGNGCSACFQ